MKPKALTTRETLEVLKNFTTEIGSFAIREGKIDYAEKLRESSLRQSEEEARARVEEQILVAKSELRDLITQSKCQLEEKFAQRKERIEKAKLNVRYQMLDGIQAAEGHKRYDLQRKMMDSAKQRDRKIAQAREQVDAQKAPFLELEAAYEQQRLGALKAFRGFPAIKKKLLAALEGKGGPANESFPPNLEDAYQKTTKAWKKIRRNPLIGLYAWIPLWVQLLILVVLGAVAFWYAPQLGIDQIAPPQILIITGAAVGFALLFYLAVIGAVGGHARVLAKCFRYVRSSRDQVYGQLQEWFDEQKALYEAEHREVEVAFREGLQSTGAAAGSKRLSAPEQIDQKAHRILNRLKTWKEHQGEWIEKNGLEKLQNIDRSFADALAAALATSEQGEDYTAHRARLMADWDVAVEKQNSLVQNAVATYDPGRNWLQQTPDQWKAPTTFPEEAIFGQINYRLGDSGARLPAFSLEQSSPITEKSSRIPLQEFQLPLRLMFPSQGSILIETGNSRGIREDFANSRSEAIQSLNQIVGALLTSAPAGRLSFSLIDPVGLGESFAGLMHLSDYEEHLVNKRVRTQPDQIESRLGELCEHMEKVIQMYLRNEYATISEYNQAAGTTAERYHFLVVADFPRQFTDEAARRLLSIAQSGARCGVFTLIHHDCRANLPNGFILSDLQRSSVCLKSTPDGFILGEEAVPGTSLQLLTPPDNATFLKWIHKIGEANRDSNRISVPFSTIAPDDARFWSVNTSRELRVPIGRTGATKFQELAIGKGTCQHALIAGKTGSGKSTLFHVMITNMALWCDPDQVEFYLIDFKKGVEFKAYATHQLPHARVIAIESDREFGLSVLQKLDEELKERGEKFRALGAQDIAGYQKAGGKEAMPRTLLLIDEFQEFFVEDDQISQQAAVLLDRIVRQGRAFGIHAILGSQTLGGAFTLARATLGQMVIRIALMCNEADAYLIMDDSNPAPRLLTRPGEGIYNDRAGAAEANSPFQVVWLDDEDRAQYLTRVSQAAAERGLDQRPRVVFEGNAPAQITEDRYITNLLARREFSGPPRLFLGAPNSIKSPTEAVFDRQSGSNLLIVGQRDDVVEGMILIGLRLLIAQLGKKGRFILIDGQVADPNGHGRLKESITWLGDAVICPPAHEMGDVINQLAAEMKGRSDGSAQVDGSTTTFLIILGLQKYKKLRYEEDYSFSSDPDAPAKPSDSLNALITEGPSLGYHSIISIDTYNNVNRCLSRKGVAEFEKKILFQMSAGDSASLIDSSKASDLGMNRAIYYNEPTGIAETFRPYAQPGREWFENQP